LDRDEVECVRGGSSLPASTSINREGEKHMNFRHQAFLFTLAVLLACALLTAPVEAQFFQQAKLVGTGIVTGPLGVTWQGISASLSSDGDTAIIGGPYDANTTPCSGNPSCEFSAVGAAWVFTRSAGVWTQQTKLVGTGAIGNAFQGDAVSLSADGHTAIVGGLNDNDLLGAAWVFTRSGGLWTQQAKLVGTGAIGLAGQGRSVSLSADGNTAIVGGLYDDGATGAAWVFTRSAGVWAQQAKLIGTGAIGNADQGVSVALSSNGTAIAGGYFDNNETGAAWMYVLFAGAPGTASCHGQSVLALAKQYGGLNNAAAAVGHPSVSALQDAIMAYCEG
jgi:hypothetical protein